MIIVVHKTCDSLQWLFLSYDSKLGILSQTFGLVSCLCFCCVTDASEDSPKNTQSHNKDYCDYCHLECYTV